MSLQTRLNDFITAVGTDYKNFKTWMFGSTSGSLSDLATTDKSSFVGAINELKASSGSPADASTTVKGVVELATGAETITGTDTVRAITPSGLTSKLDTDGTLAGNLDTRIATQKATKTYVDTAISGVSIPDASDTVKGKVELATDSETFDGVDTARAITPASLQAKVEGDVGLSSNSAQRIPSTSAVRAYISNQIDTDDTLAANSNAKIASQKATKTYVDTAISGVSIADASDTVKGKVELATGAETITGTDATRAVTPSGLTSKLDTDGTLAGNLDTRIATQKAVKTYVDTAISGVSIADASTTVKGKVELATDLEATTGTDTVRAVTPANVAAVFLDRIDTNTALGTSNTKIASQNAVKSYVDGLLDAANALQYKGVIDASTNPNYPAASAGHMYVISVAGKIGGASGVDVEVGDMVICTVDGTSAGTQAGVGANWNIIQKNIVGAVTGPASSTNGTLATFNGTSGKIIQDSAVSISTDGTMASNADTLLSTQKAVRTYLAANFYTKTELGDPETDLAALYAAAKA